MTTAVRDELRRGVDTYPTLAGLAVDWLEDVRVDDLASLGVFAQYVRLLGSGARDIGEAATLAWAEVHGATAVLDDAAARRAGKERGVDVHGTLWLVANGLRSSLLTEDQAISLVDALRLAEAWLPCDGRGFLDWCRRERLL